MRLAFFLLVLANLLFFAWSAGYLGGQEEGREPFRLQNQLQPEKMNATVVAPSSVPPPSPSDAAPAPTPPAAPAPGPASPGASGASTAVMAAKQVPAARTEPAAVAAASSASVCRRIAGVPAKDAGVFQQALQKVGFTAAVLPAEERSFWVHIPALPSKAVADKKAGELKSLGVMDFHVMQGEGGNFVISLGLFGDEAAATQFLASMARKGVKSARMDTRAKPTGVLRVELHGTADLVSQRLPSLLSALPGAKTMECP